MQSPNFCLATRLRRCAPPIPHARLPLLGIAARNITVRRLSLAVQAAKGFGKQNPVPANARDDDERKRKGKGKAKRVQLQPGPIPNQQRQQQQFAQDQFQTKLLTPEPPEEEDEFMTRLQALKAQGKENIAASATTSSVAEAATLAVTPAIFDAGPTSVVNNETNIYANPPPLSQTLLAAAGGGAAASDISDPKLRDAKIGPSQVGLAVGALVFVVVFLIAAAGDYAPSSRRYSGVMPAQAPLDPIEEKILKSKISLYENELIANPNDDNTAGVLATTYARMMQYDKAVDVLEKLGKRNPTNAEVWRLLGESALLSQQPRKAVPAFERAVELRRSQERRTAPDSAVISQPDIQLLTGLVDAYVANSEYPKAVDALRAVREEIRSKSSTTAAAAASSSGSAVPLVVPNRAGAVPQGEGAAPPPSLEVVAADAGVEPQMLTAPSLTDNGSAITSSSAAAPVQEEAASESPVVDRAVRPLDPVSIELLTSKVYSAWRGHDQEALVTYDELIKVFPEDYRGYLAKGLFLKEKGRKADAERMFLQARFFAPSSKQQLIRSIAEATPVAPEMPDN